MHTLDEPDLDAITTVGPPLGQVYEPDEQCKRMFTSNSELARVSYFSDSLMYIIIIIMSVLYFHMH